MTVERKDTMPTSTIEQTRRRTSPMWLAVGLAIGLIAAPAAAVAATITAVNIIGPNGVRAQVSAAGQLETTPASPSSLRVFYKLGIAGDLCTPIYTAPPGTSLILQQVSVDVFADPSPGSGDTIALSTDDQCQNLLFDDNPSTIGATVFPLGPGIVVPGGHSLYAIGKDLVEGEVYGYGYVVPVADAPTPTLATGSLAHLGADAVQRSTGP
jgi:hypothetical protein